jgi:hypothetical protein
VGGEHGLVRVRPAVDDLRPRPEDALDGERGQVATLLAYALADAVNHLAALAPDRIAHPAVCAGFLHHGC